MAIHSKPDNSVPLCSAANPCYTTQPVLKNARSFCSVFHPPTIPAKVGWRSPQPKSPSVSQPPWLLALIALLGLLTVCDGLLQAIYNVFEWRSLSYWQDGYKPFTKSLSRGVFSSFKLLINGHHLNGIHSQFFEPESNLNRCNSPSFFETV
jgi:hypothetical protein